MHLDHERTAQYVKTIQGRVDSIGKKRRGSAPEQASVAVNDDKTQEPDENLIASPATQDGAQLNQDDLAAYEAALDQMRPTSTQDTWFAKTPKSTHSRRNRTPTRSRDAEDDERPEPNQQVKHIAAEAL